MEIAVVPALVKLRQERPLAAEPRGVMMRDHIVSRSHQLWWYDQWGVAYVNASVKFLEACVQAVRVKQSPGSAGANHAHQQESQAEPHACKEQGMSGEGAP